MKKITNFTFGIASVLAISGASLLPVSAWSDNTNGRKSYTISEIEHGVLGDKIVFNSISNGVIGDEKNFVGARINDGTKSAKTNLWHDQIKVEAGKTYLIRLYVHNNNPKKWQAVAENVTTTFNLKSDFRRTQKVGGYISASNATPSVYYDDVVFTSDKAFRLEYVKGSARLENNGIGSKTGGYILGDGIVKNGVKIGYNALDGKIPGCFQFDSYVGIEVKPVFTDQSFYMDKKVRLAGTENWQEQVNAKVGDKVEFRINYRNLAGKKVSDVMVRDSLPNNLQLVKGTTRVFNASNQKGLLRDDAIHTTGVNIGGYKDNGNAYVTFTTVVIDKNLACGNNKLINYGKITADKKVLIDTADVFVAKACEQKILPKTGPASLLMAALGLGGLTTAIGLYLASRKQ